jgi:biopolymer transport protein ExbB
MSSGGLLGGLAGFYAYVGPVGVILLALSLYSLTLIIGKALTFWNARLGQTTVFERALERFETSGADDAIKTLGDDSHPISEMLRTGAELARAGENRGKIEANVRAVASDWMARLSHHNRMLELIGLVAPLLGLLGTILGMITAFQALQTSGAQADPSVLAGGIWEALLTTAFGLAVAIPAIVAFNLSENRIDRLRQQASTALGRFFASLQARA